MDPGVLLNHINHQFEEQRDIFLRDNPVLQGEYIHVNVAVSNTLLGEYFTNWDHFDAVCGARGWRVWRDDPYRTEVRTRYHIGERVRVQIPQPINLFETDIETPLETRETIVPIDPQGGYIVPPHIAEEIIAISPAPVGSSTPWPTGYSTECNEDGEAIIVPCYLTEEPISEEDWADINDF